MGRDQMLIYSNCATFHIKQGFPLHIVAPLTISLMKLAGPQEYVSAGVTEELECSTTGSRPEPIISWWRDGQRILNPSVKVSHFGRCVYVC